MNNKVSAARRPSAPPDAPSIGRPPEMRGGKRINLYLDADTLTRARRIDPDSISAAVRKAIMAYGRRIRRAA